MTDLFVLGIILYALNKFPTGDLLNAGRRFNEVVAVERAEPCDCCWSSENILQGPKVCGEDRAPGKREHGRHSAHNRDSHRDAQGRFAEVLPKEKR